MSMRQKGFTLIELVVVITILGILAAFAIPRFAGLETSARVAAINGLAGSVRAAASLAHSVALVNGNTASESVTLEGQAVTMTNYYPTATTAGITAALQDTSGFTDNGDGTLDFTTAPTPATCRVTYTAAPANGAPTTTVATGGC
ncbi:MAG TPA: type II secretion system protein [Gammaproteobacteria bacterium]